MWLVNVRSETIHTLNNPNHLSAYHGKMLKNMVHPELPSAKESVSHCEEIYI